MSVEQALRMRDRIKRKIDSKVGELEYAYGVCIPSEDEDMNRFRLEYCRSCSDKAKSCYQSLSTLAFNYDILSAAIMESNHNTKLPQRNSMGNFMTVAEGISVLESSPTPKIYSAIKESRDSAMKILSKNPNGTISDPFGDKILETIGKYENYCDLLRSEIDSLNKSTTIEVRLAD